MSPERSKDRMESDRVGVPESTDEVIIRPFEDSDSQKIADLARKNFRGPSFSLLPKNVIDAYLAANRLSDIRHAVNDDGTEAYVADQGSGDVSGFLLLRSNSGQTTRRNAYGDLDIRRLHVDPETQGKGIGRRFFSLARQRAEELNTAYITSHASGGSRVFFERNGWEGKTILNHMPKRNVSALVFSCMTQVGEQREHAIYPEASHLIYAGTSESRIDFLRSQTEGRINFQAIPGKEPEIEDVLETARAKALSVGRQVRGNGVYPIVVANDTRTDILIPGGPRYGYQLANKGKPKTPEEARENFKAMYKTSKITKKPVPYIVRTATYIHDPKNPENDLSSEHDVSIWLSTSALHVLSHPSGFRNYRAELRDLYGVDVTQISAGFAVPIFFDHGWIDGLNGHPYDILPNKEVIKEDVLHTALVGVDAKLLAERV